MGALTFRGGTVILDKTGCSIGAEVVVNDGRISAINTTPAGGKRGRSRRADTAVTGLCGVARSRRRRAADFMDGTAKAFQTVCRAHARHGTTSLLPTCTVASHRTAPDIPGAYAGSAKKKTYRRGARAVGAHFYGPYFAYGGLRQLHPAAGIRCPPGAGGVRTVPSPSPIASSPLTACAPELPAREAFSRRACRAKGKSPLHHRTLAMRDI